MKTFSVFGAGLNHHNHHQKKRDFKRSSETGVLPIVAGPSGRVRHVGDNVGAKTAPFAAMQRNNNR